MSVETDQTSREIIVDLANRHASAVDELSAKIAKLEDLTRRQAMLITKLVREHAEELTTVRDRNHELMADLQVAVAEQQRSRPVVHAAKAWLTAYRSDFDLEGARRMRKASQELAGAVHNTETH